MRKKAEQTPRERLEELLEYVNLLRAEYLGVADWIINVSDEPCRSDCKATIGTNVGQKVAHIRVAYDWHKETPESIRHTITHELCHLHWEQAWEFARNAMSLSDFNAFEFMAEYGVDAFARILSPNMPLPKFSWLRGGGK